MNQVNECYQTRHPRMRAYWNEIWDMLINLFTEHTVQVISRYENMVADSLATAARRFEAPIVGKRKYKVDIVNRLTRQHYILASFQRQYGDQKISGVV